MKAHSDAPREGTKTPPTETELKHHPVFGYALEFQKDPIRFLNLIEKHHKFYRRFRFAHLKMVYLSHPDYIKHVLQVNNKNYSKGIEYEHLKPVLGMGLLTSEGDFWLRQRRLAQPAFHKQRIASFMNDMITSTRVMLEDWEKHRGKTIDLHPEMMKLTLDIVAKTLLSAEVKNEAANIGHALGLVIEESYKRVQSMVNFPLWLPLPSHLRYNKERRVLDKVIIDIIEERRAKPSDKYNDLLTMLMDAKDEDTGETMNNKQLRDEVMTIFLAGHETTSNALTWTFYLIAKHPEIEEKLRREIDVVLQGAEPSVDQVHELIYSLQVIQEAMRLYPPAWVLGRTALSDDNISDKVKIKKGDNILISPYMVHRMNDFWDDPEQFKPERFLPEKVKTIPKFLYFPFGGGPRFCIGNNFAMLEMQLVMAMVLQRYKLTHIKEHKVELEPLITLRPKHGMKMKLQ